MAETSEFQPKGLEIRLRDWTALDHSASASELLIAPIMASHQNWKAREKAAISGDTLTPLVATCGQGHYSPVRKGRFMSMIAKLPNRLRRCRNCGIRVPRNEKVYGHRACSEDCADNLWLKEMFRDD